MKTTTTIRQYASDKVVQFVIDVNGSFAKANVDREMFEGWSNSNTWCFWLYFSQESVLMDYLAELRRPSRGNTINPNKAMGLFARALRMGSMESIDKDYEGPVNVNEILHEYHVTRWVTS